MPRNKRLRHGVGAKISVDKNFLYPHPIACANTPNASKNAVLHDLIGIEPDEKCVSDRAQGCILMQDADFYDGQFRSSATRYYAARQDRLYEFVSNEPQQEHLRSGGHVAGLVASTEVLEVAEFLKSEFANFRSHGFAVDDDNEPALETIPRKNDTEIEGLYHPWESKPFKMQRLDEVKDVQPNLVSTNPNVHVVMSNFLHLLPVDFLKTTVIEATNTTLSDPLTWQELLQFLGLLLLVGTAPPGDPRSSFWANDNPDRFDSLHTNMSRQRFESILKHLSFKTTDSPAPWKHSFSQEVNEMNDTFKDQYHQFGGSQVAQINCSSQSKSNSADQISFLVSRANQTKPKRGSGLLESVCGVETAPPFAGSWTGIRWEFLSSKYPQHVCKSMGCPKRIRTYCKCMIGHWMCKTCIGIHIASRVDSS